MSARVTPSPLEPPSSATSGSTSTTPVTIDATTTITAQITTTTSADPTTTTRPEPVLSAAAATYLDEAIALMKEWSINTDKVDWNEIEALALRLADGAVSPANTYYAIRLAMGELGDGHSVFFTPAEATGFDSGAASFDTPRVEVGEDDIGYVAIGRYIGNIGEQADDFAAELAARLEAEIGDVCGWIVDLRHNTGGNMWPMIGGLAPLLGDGVVGYFTYPNGRTETWELADGVALWNGMPMVSYGPTSTDGGDAPVAVLIGGRTASSGEAVTVAFHGRPNTMLFGQNTTGLTTSNEPLWLSDGAMMALTMSVFTDRNGLAYGFDQSVEPDVPAGSDAMALDDEPLTLATTWLLDQPACEA